MAWPKPGCWSLQLDGFVDEHDGNIVFNAIKKLAVVADKTIPGLVQMNVLFAFWTR